VDIVKQKLDKPDAPMDLLMSLGASRRTSPSPH